MKKKFSGRIAVIVISLALILGGCGSAVEMTPDSPDREAVLAATEMYAELSNNTFYGGKLDYEIESCEINGDTAKVTIQFIINGKKSPKHLDFKKNPDTGEWKIKL